MVKAAFCGERRENRCAKNLPKSFDADLAPVLPVYGSVARRTVDEKPMPRVSLATILESTEYAYLLRFQVAAALVLLGRTNFELHLQLSR